jgi:hypothetical protein
MRLSLAAVGTAGAVAALAAYRRQRPGDDLVGEVALVTGSSRGLGLLIAAELAERGCRLLLCATAPNWSARPTGCAPPVPRSPRSPAMSPARRAPAPGVPTRPALVKSSTATTHRP